MMGFLEGFVLFLFQGLLLVLVAQTIRTLANEVKHLRTMVHAMIADEPKKLEAAGDPVVHDFHTSDDRYASVTKRAEKDWEAA